jgi:hypothetical protein
MQSNTNWLKKFVSTAMDAEIFAALTLMSRFLEIVTSLRIIFAEPVTASFHMSRHYPASECAEKLSALALCCSSVSLRSKAVCTSPFAQNSSLAPKVCYSLVAKSRSKFTIANTIVRSEKTPTRDADKSGIAFESKTKTKREKRFTLTTYTG